MTPVPQLCISSVILYEFQVVLWWLLWTS